MTESRKFYLVDSDRRERWSVTDRQSRLAMVEFAFQHGATEVKHDYDLVRFDGSGKQR